MSRFRTIEVSDPQFEVDGLKHITVQSPALGRRGDFSVFVPSQATGMESVPAIFLLHGVTGSHWAWAFSGGTHITTQRLIDEKIIQPFVVIMPSDGLWGDGSGYFPHNGSDYEKWIVDDVWDCAKEVVPVLSDESKQFMGGLSMGGFGAMRLGAKYADRYSGISAHSSITCFSQMHRFVKNPIEEYNVPEELLPELNVAYWAGKNRDKLPPFRFDCGRKDPLIEENRALHETLKNEGIDHIYDEFEGGHQWIYWRDHIVDTLKFFNDHL